MKIKVWAELVVNVELSDELLALGPKDAAIDAAVKQAQRQLRAHWQRTEPVIHVTILEEPK